MRKLARLIANIPEVIGGLTMLGITLILFAGVIWRYFLVDPLTWSDEISRVLFMWLAFIGAAVGVKRRLHSSVTVLTVRMRPAGQRAATLLALLVTAVMGAVLLYTGAHETVNNFKQVLPVTGLSRGWLYLAVPVSGALILAYLVPQVLSVLRGVPLPSHHEIGAE